MSSYATLERISDPSVRIARKRRGRGAKAIIPTGLVAGATGVVGAANPLAGLGITGMALVSFLPWVTLFAALSGAAVANRWGIQISGASLRIAQALMVPFVIRAVLFTKDSLKPRWQLPEWTLIGFVVVNGLSTYFYARLVPGHRSSELSALIELLGVMTYLAVFISVCTPQRLRTATRIFLGFGAGSAAFGIMSFLGYYVGFNFGVDARYVPAFNGAPAIKGIAYEHDIFGSTCAFVAIVFLVLMRERSDLFSRKWTERLFWCSLGGMILSQSRGAWIGFVMVFIAYYMIGFRRRPMVRATRMLRTTAVVTVLGVVGIASLYFTNQQTSTSPPPAIAGLGVTLSQKVWSAFNLGSTNACDGCNTGSGRIRRWTKGVDEVINTSPVIGLGTASYGLRNFRPSPFTWPYLAPAYIESLYVRTLYDTGVVGLLLLLVFLGWLLWPRKELMHAPGDLPPIARALTFGGITLALAYGVTDSTQLIWPWIAFGLIRAATTLATRQGRELRAAVPEAPMARVELEEPAPNGDPSPVSGGVVGADWIRSSAASFAVWESTPPPNRQG